MAKRGQKKSKVQNRTGPCEGNDQLEGLKKSVKNLRRPAFQAIVELGDGPTTASKYSGKAYIPKGEAWPICSNCQEPMQLFIQLDLGDLPKELGGLFGKGLLQVFYCTNVEPNCEADNSGWETYSKNAVVRVVRPRRPGENIEVPKSNKYFPAKRITGWHLVEDYPGLYDLKGLGVEFGYEHLDRIIEEDRKGIWPSPRQGNKLGGWPFWCQSPEYPECIVCGEPMRLLFQIDSDEDLPYMFGDVGTGHITQCEKHKDVVTFNWACH